MLASEFDVNSVIVAALGGGGIGATVTAILTKALPWLVEYFRHSESREKFNAEVKRDGYQAVILRLDERVKKLEQNEAILIAKLEHSQNENEQCLVVQAELRTELRILKDRLTGTERRLSGK